jgi:hypothetical protein
MLYYVIFIFVAFVAKLLLAGAMIYLLFPTERSCVECDYDTLHVRPAATGRTLSFCSAGRLQWRWCPRCGWQGWARTSAPPREPRMQPMPVSAPPPNDHGPRNSIGS